MAGAAKASRTASSSPDNRVESGPTGSDRVGSGRIGSDRVDRDCEAYDARPSPGYSCEGSCVDADREPCGARRSAAARKCGAASHSAAVCRQQLVARITLLLLIVRCPWRNQDRRASESVPSRRRIFRRAEPGSRSASTQRQHSGAGSDCRVERVRGRARRYLRLLPAFEKIGAFPDVVGKRPVAIQKWHNATVGVVETRRLATERQ